MKHKALCESFKLKYPPLAVWRASDLPPTEGMNRGCSLRGLHKALEGASMTLTTDNLFCSGAASGFGFRDGVPDVPGGFSKFLTTGSGKGFPAGERIKCSEALAEAMIQAQPTGVMDGYNAMVIEPFDDQSETELVLFLVNPDQLAALVHLFNYRRADYDSVIMPMSSGCASIFRIPFGERDSGRGRAVIGNVDVFSRPHFDADTFFFTISARSYQEMLADADESFLIAPIWNGVKKRL